MKITVKAYHTNKGTAFVFTPEDPEHEPFVVTRYDLARLGEPLTRAMSTAMSHNDWVFVIGASAFYAPINNISTKTFLEVKAILVTDDGRAPGVPGQHVSVYGYLDGSEGMMTDVIYGMTFSTLVSSNVRQSAVAGVEPYVHPADFHVNPFGDGSGEVVAGFRMDGMLYGPDGQPILSL